MSMSFDIITNVLVTTHTYRISSIEAGSPVLELPGGGLGGPGPLSSGSAPDPHYRLALRARHKAPENFLIIRPLRVSNTSRVSN